MPIAAENAIRLIRTVTDKPVSVLVNTHWHGDHNLGNQVFRARFPGLRIVSHENTRRSMLGKAMGDVTKYHVQIDDFLKQLEALKAKGEWSERREGLLADTRTLRGYFDDPPLVLTPPDVTFTDRLILHRRERRRGEGSGPRGVQERDRHVGVRDRFHPGRQDPHAALQSVVDRTDLPFVVVRSERETDPPG